MTAITRLFLGSKNSSVCTTLTGQTAKLLVSGWQRWQEQDGGSLVTACDGTVSGVLG